MSKKVKKRIAFCIALFTIIMLYWWGFSLKCEEYEISSDKISSTVRLVFISDLHNCFYGGTDQSEIIDIIEEIQPDAVLFGGDAIDQYGGTKYSLKLMKSAAEKYPCYYTHGNHEEMRDDIDSFYAEVDKLNIHRLEGQGAELFVKGQKIKVYGVSDAYMQGKKKTQLQDCLEDLDNSCYNILLAHSPEQYTEYFDSSNKVQFDLVLSGHAHGGQWRIPGILEQGVYSPDQGIFPDYTNGKFSYGDSVHIVSRGLARPLRMIFIPRIFNRPELSLISIN